MEDQLNSWKPRGPSARLEQAIFDEGRGTSVESRPSVGLDRLGWFLNLRHAGWTAVTSLGLVAIALMNADEWGGRFATVERGGIVPDVVSNQSCAASLAMAQGSRNVWSALILGWTNEGASLSTTQSLGPLTTNFLSP